MHLKAFALVEVRCAVRRLLVPLSALGAEDFVTCTTVEPDCSLVGVFDCEGGSVAAVIADPLLSAGEQLRTDSLAAEVLDDIELEQISGAGLFVVADADLAHDPTVRKINAMDFVLLHGTTQAPSGWDLLVRALAERGHRAAVVDLPTDQPDLKAADYAQIAADQVEFDQPVVVGHSGAGLLLPAVGSAMGASRLVWLAAAIPGEVSYREEVAAHGDEIAQPEWRSVGPELLSDPVACSYFLFHDCDLATLRWALGTIRLFLPVGVYREQLSVPELPSVFVLPERDRTLRPEWMAKTARERLGVEPVTIDAGHCPHVSTPVQLAELITAP